MLFSKKLNIIILILILKLFKNNCVFFCGEATNYKYMGTVHGAYITGREVANKIIRLDKK